jgi:hypothetical protein
VKPSHGQVMSVCCLCCGVAPGRLCEDPFGNTRKPHEERKDFAEEVYEKFMRAKSRVRLTRKTRAVSCDHEKQHKA